MSEEKSQNLLETIQSKITELIDEFRASEISRERFNIVYARYHKQLDLAYRVASDDMKNNSSDEGTFKLDDVQTGKATGVGIYHHKSERIIATLGAYDLSLEQVATILESQSNVDKPSKPLDNGRWLVSITEDFTTAIVIYNKEANQRQIMSLGRIMHDFERANAHLLAKSEIDSDKLAQPFLSVVKIPK